MGVRFHRSLKIAPGIRLNVSKSGLGVSVGPRGAKLSVGPNGVYTNVGIPGTGIYSRQKTTNWDSSSPSSNPSPESRSIEVKIFIDDETGKESIKLMEGDREINDDSLLRKIKRDPDFKEKLVGFREKYLQEVQEKESALINVHKHSEAPTDWDAVRKQVNDAVAVRYQRKKLAQPEPNRKIIEGDLIAEANRTIKSLFGKKKKREQYVQERIDSLYDQKVSEWKAKIEAHEVKQDQIEKEENDKYDLELAEWKKEMNRLLNPDMVYIEERLEDLFSEIQLPVEFSISFDVRDSGNLIVLDIDLPEIENFPLKKMQMLASGKISVKNKTQKEIKQDYLLSTTGISFYFASIAFSSAPIIEKVLVSGYTQRINKATGNTEDEYVYTVIFTKDQFQELNIENIDPSLALQQFEHRIDMTKTFDLKTIIPF